MFVDLVSSSRRRLLASVLAAAALLSGCGTAPTTATAPAVRAALAPTGSLRVAVYPGSPTSLVAQAPLQDMRGVTVDLGRSLANRLGIPAEIVVYPRLAEALAAMQRGEADFTVTNATPERARVVDFAPTLVDLELGVLVRPGSGVKSVEQMDSPGVTLGVSKGSSSERVLTSRLKHSKLSAFQTLDAARTALQANEIDAFATNKGILFELAERVAGAQVLQGRWGTEHLAPAIPKGREAGLDELRKFTQTIRENGELSRASERAGLRGTVPAPP